MKWIFSISMICMILLIFLESYIIGSVGFILIIILSILNEALDDGWLKGE